MTDEDYPSKAPPLLPGAIEQLAILQVRSKRGEIVTREELAEVVLNATADMDWNEVLLINIWKDFREQNKQNEITKTARK